MSLISTPVTLLYCLWTAFGDSVPITSSATSIKEGRDDRGSSGGHGGKGKKRPREEEVPVIEDEEGKETCDGASFANSISLAL